MLVIPCAGAASRFEGWTTPKPFLPFLGVPMLTHVRRMFPREERTVYVFLEKHREMTEIAPTLPGDVVVFLKDVSRGPADTVLQGLLGTDGLDMEEPLWICNCDSLLAEEFSWNGLGNHLITIDGQTNPAFSYVQVQEAHPTEVLMVAEKKVISELASAGLYRFESVNVFAEAFTEAAQAPEGGELFVSPLYQRMLNWRASPAVTTQTLPSSALLSSGTPQQYLTLLSGDVREPYRRF